MPAAAADLRLVLSALAATATRTATGRGDPASLTRFIVTGLADSLHGALVAAAPACMMKAFDSHRAGQGFTTATSLGLHDDDRPQYNS